jgi:YtcA-like protein
MKARRNISVNLLSIPLGSCALVGCSSHGAPTLSLFGAFFPAWMFCGLVGILAAIGARGIFVATGLSDILPFQLFVCASIGVCFALIVWSLGFGY